MGSTQYHEQIAINNYLARSCAFPGNLKFSMIELDQVLWTTLPLQLFNTFRYGSEVSQIDTDYYEANRCLKYLCSVNFHLSLRIFIGMGLSVAITAIILQMFS